MDPPPKQDQSTSTTTLTVTTGNNSSINSSGKGVGVTWHDTVVDKSKKQQHTTPAAVPQDQMQIQQPITMNSGGSKRTIIVNNTSEIVQVIGSSGRQRERRSHKFAGLRRKVFLYRDHEQRDSICLEWRGHDE
ncbi:hypothetical protein Pelo_13939 [Pelomyxa schiedti]|nr:hypothetical protein Pelo_13939 [Pelomyxa schiedti]